MVRVTYCKHDKTTYVIHDSETYGEGLELEKWLRKNKRVVEDLYEIEVKDVIRLNVDVDSEFEKAEKVVLDENCEDLKL